MHTSLFSAAFALLVFVSASSAHAQTYRIQGTSSSAPARVTTTATSSSAPARATTSAASSQSPVTDVKQAEGQDGGVNTAVGDINGDSTGGTEAGTDYLLKLGGVEGESEEGRAPGVEPDEIDNNITDEEAAKKKGKVDTTWKVEEGQKAAVPGAEPDEIDVMEEPEPVMPDFSILIGGGSPDVRDDETTNSPLEELILNGMKEEGVPVDQISLNYEEFKFTAKKTVKLFGFIPVSATATVEYDAESKAKVTFPWWTFFATGKDADSLIDQISAALTNVVRSKAGVVLKMRK
ncbi:MAG: hypothetical protein ABL890_04070 [Candidatus Peribacteraceae bacterium]